MKRKFYLLIFILLISFCVNLGFQFSEKAIFAADSETNVASDVDSFLEFEKKLIELKTAMEELVRNA